MINKLYLVSFSKIALLWLIMYLLIILINYKDIREKKKYNLEEIKKDKLLAQIYIDQFYITNKFYTFFVTFIYIFSIVLIFVFLRYLSINDFMIVSAQESLYNMLLFLIIIYLLLFVTIVLYKSLLTVLCKKEINKFYLYLKQYYLINPVYDMLEYKPGDRIFGSLYLIFYRISTLEYKYPFYGKEFEKAHRFIVDDELDYIIHNQRIIDYAYLALLYARKYKIVQKFFKMLASMFRFFYKHISKLNELFAYFILVSIFIIELYSKEFHHIYIILFICLLIKIKCDFFQYKRSRCVYYDGILSKYFYRNQTPYKEQRIYFHTKDNITISKSFDSENNNRLFRSLKDIIDYTFNDFKDNYEPSFEVKQEERRNKGMYRRFYIILGFILINFYLLIIDWLMILLLLPMSLMIYTHYKTYYVSKYDERIYVEEYEYNRKYNIIFWIFTILQGYIFWLLLLKPELIFMDTETLLKLPFSFGNIVKVYNIEEKTIYLYNYFEFYINLIDDEALNKDYLRYILRQIDFKTLINDTVRLKDIQIYIKLLIDNYYFNEVIYRMLEEHINNKIIEESTINTWYVFMYNILFLGAITSTMIYYKNIWVIIKQISTSEGVFKLIKDIYSRTIKNKLTYEMLVNVIMKIFKW